MLDTSEAALEITHDKFTPDYKRLATATARAALAGVALTPINDDFGRQVFVASRWDLTTQLDSLDEVEAWLSRVTGVRA